MKVYLSPTAEQKFTELLNFLKEKWGESSQRKFLSRFLRKTHQISRFPGSCPESQKMAGLYKCVVTSQTTFFYRIYNYEVEIVTIFDKRQDPEKADKKL